MGIEGPILNCGSCLWKREAVARHGGRRTAWGACPNGRLGVICGLCMFLQQPRAPPGHGRRRTGRRCHLYTVQSSRVFAVFIPEKTQKSRRLNSVATSAGLGCPKAPKNAPGQTARGWQRNRSSWARCREEWTEITKIYHQGACVAQLTFEQPCRGHHTFEHRVFAVRK